MFGSVWNSGKVLAAAVAILLAGGCGGSSSSSPPPPPPPPPPPVNQAPTADAGPDQSVTEGTAVTLDGSGSADSDGTVDVYTWTQTGGTTVTLDLSTPSMPTFTAPLVAANENLTFELVVTDNDSDDSAADVVVVTVADVPAPAPIANAGPDQTVDEGTAVALDGSGSSDSDGTVDAYSWTQTTGTVVALDLTTPSMPTFTAPQVDADEALTFELVVTDNDGQLSAPDIVVVTVTNVLVAPVANAGADQTVSSLDLVTLDGSASTDSDGTIEGYSWSQTAGPAVTLDVADPVMPTFTAPNVGADVVLTFELVVSDDDGVDSVPDSVNVTINPTLALPFSDNFQDGNSDGWISFDDSIENASSWNVAAGRFVQTVDTNTFGKDVDETYRRGTYAYLTDSVNLTDYRFEVDITRLTGTSDDIGVMFRYQDNDNYYRFSMNSESGSSRLESKVNGTFVTLANNNRGYDADQFLFDVVIEVEGSLIQVFVNNDPLFAANVSDHDTGGIALYGRDGVAFDNVSITTNSVTPRVVIASPVAHTVIPGAPRDIDVTAIARNVPAGGSVEFQVDGILSSCNAATESSLGVFNAVCPNVAIGNRLIRANLLDNSPSIVDFDSNVSVGLGATNLGDNYDAIGDSITLGLMDNYRRDNLSLTDQRTIGFQGWAGVLGDRLTTANGQFNLVGNEGIPGDTSADTRFQRLNSIIERNPESNRALVMLGTNDTNAFPSPVAPATLVGNLTNIANRLLNTGAGIRDRDVVYIASLPPIFGESLNTPYPDPLDPSATRNQQIIAYNAAIQGAAWPAGVQLGPDFFSCFLTPTNNRFSLFADSLHPNGLGHAMMAALWEDAIVNGPPAFPMDPCPSPVYIVESLNPYAHGHKQNLLEVGDRYYNDASFTLTAIPTELEDGVWITQSNADNADATNDFLSFDVGASPVTVYVAYDPVGAEPVSNLTLTASVLSGPLSVSDPAIVGGDLAVVEAAGVTGAVTIGGTASNGGPASQAYVVIVVP